MIDELSPENVIRILAEVNPYLEQLRDQGISTFEALFRDGSGASDHSAS
jgi:hypothetical protein